MPRITSILDEKEWRENFGDFLQSVASEQSILPKEIGKRLDRLENSEGRGRASDWWRYTKGVRVPTKDQADQLADALKIPRHVFRVCAGYVDDIFECAYAAIYGETPAEWNFPVGPRKAAIALLFTLFPTDEGMHVGNTGSLFFWMSGHTVKLNLTSDEGFLTGEDWNGTWLFPVRSPAHLVDHHETPDNPHIVWMGEPRKEPWTWYSMRALLQVDLASPVASQILGRKCTPIPRGSPLREAQLVLHRKSLPLHARLGLAANIIHCWADQFDKDLAEEIRKHLHPWCERTITDDAARWVRGERIEIDESLLQPGKPRPIIAQLYSWDGDGRPVEFWR